MSSLAQHVVRGDTVIAMEQATAGPWQTLSAPQPIRRQTCTTSRWSIATRGTSTEATSRARKTTPTNCTRCPRRSAKRRLHPPFEAPPGLHAHARRRVARRCVWRHLVPADAHRHRDGGSSAHAPGHGAPTAHLCSIASRVRRGHRVCDTRATRDSFPPNRWRPSTSATFRSR